MHTTRETLGHNPSSTSCHLCAKMSNDASLPPNAPITNGPETQPKVHGEEDASPCPANITPAKTPSLEAVCEDIHGRISAFLDKPPDSELRRRVQEQTRISIGVIEKALNDYECVVVASKALLPQRN